MLDVQLEELFPWLQEKYEHKYGEKLQQLKKTFLVFYNLTHQIIDIYNGILEQSTKIPYIDFNTSFEQLEPLKIVVDRTIIILHKLIDNEKLIKNKPGAIDMSFCQKFIKNFGQNLNILCTYYHSLNHCEIVGNYFKSEKKKIVEGINKLYTIHNKVRELYFKNDQDLKNIENHKLYALINIGHILLEREALFKITRGVFQSVQEQAADFYENFRQMIHYGKSNGSVGQQTNNLDSAEQTIKKLMKNYFRIFHQFCEAQAELEYYLKPIMSFCEEIKNKKKSMNYTVADSINSFSRITSQLLKSNYSLKNFKKIRMEDLYKALFTILEDIVINNSGTQFKENSQLFGHRIYKQLGLGIFKSDNRDAKGNEKAAQREKQIERERQKEKEKDKQKNKEKGREKQKKIPHSSSEKEGTRLGSKAKSSEQQSRKQGKKGDQIEKQQKQKSARQQKQEQSQSPQKDPQQQSPNPQPKNPRKPPTFPSQSPQQKIQLVVDEICQCAIFIMDCMKQLQKVQSSGLLNMIQEYKEKLSVSSGSGSGSGSNSTNVNTNTNVNNTQYQSARRMIVKLTEYQKYMGSYYRLNENIKEFQKMMREIILQEFKIKVNIIINIEPKGDYKAESMRQGKQQQDSVLKQ